MPEWLLIAVLFSPRAASHAHDIEVTRYPTQEICEIGIARTLSRNASNAVCIPVAPLPSEASKERSDRLSLHCPEVK